ncbi:MAG: DUF4386 domain-containing protein [Candidatus Thorarchaeota archaeon SMTZ1-45]|nr:MAG: hypothetical protein AM325_04040 [Candidatus Thorarchaeota archaeon SMTZ1-45]
MFVEISGFLFLLIILVLVIASSRYGYEIFSELDSDAKLQEISEDPKKFRTGTLLVVIEHVIIITLAVSLFIAFNQYNLMLGIIWVCARSGEGLIQLNRKRDYWGLLNIATQYSGASGAEKDALSDSALAILKSKNSTFSFAQILFSIGTLAYSIVFVVYETFPKLTIIGWFGIVASVIYGFGNGAKRVRPNFNALWNLGGLLIWIFELVLGFWLLYPHPPVPIVPL